MCFFLRCGSKGRNIQLILLLPVLTARFEWWVHASAQGAGRGKACRNEFSVT
jgi:hypothetical protein